MTMVVRTADLDRHKGIGLVFGHNELLTLAPGQTSASGSLILAGEVGELAKVTSAMLRTEPPGALAITPGARRAAGIDISFRANGHGAVVVYAANQPVASVTIGLHLSHLSGRSVDLISRISNGPDCRKIVAIQELLQNRPAPIIIDQRTGTYGAPDRLVCGTVVQRAGTALFGRVDHSGQSYHKPISTRKGGSMSWSDIKYDPMTTQSAVGKIKALLDRGTAVRLGAVYAPEWTMLAPNGALQAERSGGHSILAIGYSDNLFLYLDPFPDGSRTRYRGGLPFNNGKVCNYMGVLDISAERGPHLVATVDQALGPELGSMEVISGPLY